MSEADVTTSAPPAVPTHVDLDAAYRSSNIEQVLLELEGELVGLAPIKRRIREIAAMLLIARLREEQGLTTGKPTLHMSFTGRPGTGKTTVALEMAKILQQLAKKKLITSQNGPKGGYALARRPTEITVGDVVRALEGPINIVSCLEEASDCPQMAHCSLRRPVHKIQAAITQVLDTMSLAELTSADVPELFTIRA